MATFKDNADRTWRIELDGPTIQRIRSETCELAGCRHRPLHGKCEGVDLVDLTGKSFDQLELDLVLLVDVLWLLCEVQAKAAGVSQTDFVHTLAGDVLADATRALVKASCEFLPPTKRRFLERAATARERHEELAMDLAISRLENPETEQRVKEHLGQQLDAALDSQLTRSSFASVTPATSESAATG